MRATFSEEQEALRATARELAAGGLEAARAMLDGGELPAEPTRTLFEGFGGLGIPEEHGGGGGTPVDLALVLYELGRRVTPTPWVSHAIALHVAHGAGVTVPDGVEFLTLVGPECDVEPWGSELKGSATVHVHGDDDRVMAVAIAGNAVAICRPVVVRSRAPLDPTRPVADVDFDGVPVLAQSGDGTRLVALDRIRAAIAAELAGVGQGAIDLAVEHARRREQFGQPIGRFQGVAHQLADAFVGVENAWSLALYAAWAVGEQTDDATMAALSASVKAYEAAIHAAERATQVHGGIGIAWEADPHLYLRRALADSAWLGGVHWERSSLGRYVVDGVRA